MLAHSGQETSPLLNLKARPLPLRLTTRETMQCGLPGSAVSAPGLLTLKGDSQPQAWTSLANTVGTLARIAHVMLEFSSYFRVRPHARKPLQTKEHVCTGQDRSSIPWFRHAPTDRSGNRALHSFPFTMRGQGIHEVSSCPDSNQTSSNLLFRTLQNAAKAATTEGVGNRNSPKRTL